MPHELPKAYEPGAIETRWADYWKHEKLFHAPTPPARHPHHMFSLLLPPPNVTGRLHMGHMLNQTEMDIVIRWHRMRGDLTLWLPGTDHAGIATQMMVERQLRSEGKSRRDLGREAFIERVWAWRRQYGGAILDQMKRLGASVDWDREYFTMDENLSRAVREVFVRLYEEGLIYRGKYIVNWCPRCETAISDLEVKHEEVAGKLWEIRYPVVGTNEFITVATTRPETMLGDTAVAVNPEDPRGRPYIGKKVRVPIANVEIPIIADESVDKDFGTGFVKVTPAHDASDFEIGKRHKLEMPLVMREDGTMGENDGTTRIPPDLDGLDRFEARKRIVKQLERDGLLVKTEPHRHSVRRCYRCDTVVEPRLSDQWFVKMQPLAEPVLAEYRKGAFAIIPERWRATFEHWMENIRDWNISRQLWWGHRIPVFTCTTCKHQWADRVDPKQCPKCGGRVEQDPDVLDTWFSSWLWPFATFGWPRDTPDLERFYPGHTLVTAPEILFFWVARMLMSGYHFMDHRLPFATVYLHGTVRDTKHRKMSKSLGNGIDPLDVVKLFGADALRWTLIAGSSLGADVILDPNDLETTFAPGRNFANKLWNIGQFVLGQLPQKVAAIEAVDRRQLTLADRWILSRAQAMIRETTASLEQFRLDEAAKRSYEFVWNELADWYVEAVKPRLGTAAAILVYCFDAALRVLHPVVPFISEELWQRLPERQAGELLAAARWPVVRAELEDPRADREFGQVKTVIEHIRSIRAEYRVSPKTRLKATIVARGNDQPATFEGERETIMRLAQLDSLALDGAPQGMGAHAVFGDGSEVVVALEGSIDVQQECRRLSDELGRLDNQLKGLAARLTNESFVSRAPQDVVAREREKEKAWRDQRDVLAGKLKSLGCS